MKRSMLAIIINILIVFVIAMILIIQNNKMEQEKLRVYKQKDIEYSKELDRFDQEFTKRLRPAPPSVIYIYPNEAPIRNRWNYSSVGR